jgi:hypothetical protein
VPRTRHQLRNSGYQRDWYERNRAHHIAVTTTARELAQRRNKELVDEVKRRPCADCGRRYPPVAMDLDHVRGVKLNNISTMVRQPVATAVLLAELAKCEVVCANCHRIRSFTRQTGDEPIERPVKDV